MARQHAARVRLDAADLARLDATVDLIRTHDTDQVLATAAPRLDAGAAGAVAAHCRFGHAAVLVFPPSLDDLRAELRDRGLDAGPPSPSVVVRDRLSARYGRPRHALEVAILRAPVAGRDGGAGELEVFALPVPPGGGLEAVAATERAGDQEAHVALAVPDADHVVLSGLRATLVEAGGLACDGGGYNRHEDSTVLYFRGAGPRLELIARGEHAEVLAVHRRRSGQPAERLLRLMTGAWTTQAIAVAAELRLADHLTHQPDRTATATGLAALTGADPDSLRRLLRYLASLGIVAAVPGTAPGDSYALTDLGTLLRTDAEHSLRPLALLYGGAFYESFGQLLHAVRTGREGFDHLFGAHHFEYFSASPALAELFDRAMAASASIFGTVAEVVDLSAAGTVVDVAGGNGELLGHLLRAAPHLRGVLLERPGVIEAARVTLAAAGCADRCELVAGDFTEGVPAGGDVYLLSRVLHDWDDQQCRTILKRCADAMRAGAELLVLERLLPEDGTPPAAVAPLAVAWDLHMLCNVGGRERTAGHYRRLLAEAGFELVDVHDLPLEVALLRARRVPA